MTYCIDFFRKFKKEGNFCGLDKSEVSRLNAYLDIVELLMKQKIPEETVYENFPVNAARPLISAKDKARTEGLNFVTTQLKEGKKVKTGDLQDSLKSWTCPTRENARPKKVGDLQLPRREETEKSKENITPAREHAFAPLHDGEPVDPPKTLTEIAAAPPAAFTKASEPAPYVFPDLTPPCKGGKPCPGEKSYLVKQQQLGNKCEASGNLIANQKECPILRRQAEADPEFQKAMATARLELGKPIKPAGVKIIPHRDPICFIPSGQQWDFIDRIIKSGECDTPQEVLSECLDRAMEREE